MAPIKNPIAIALAAISMCIAIGVSAQTAPPAPTSAAVPPPQHQKAGMDRAKWAEKMQERMAKHIAELHDKLKITTAQEPAWKTFIESTKPSMPPGAQAMRPDHKEMDKLSTPARMEKMLEKLKEHEAMMQTRLTSLKTFYAVLTPEQQKVFDDSHRQMMHRWSKDGHGMQHGMGDMGGRGGMGRPPMPDGAMPDHPPMPAK